MFSCSHGVCKFPTQVCGIRYEAVEKEDRALEKPYTALAQLLNCEPDEIAIVTSATTAWQQVGMLTCVHAMYLIPRAAAELSQQRSNAEI